VAYYRELLQRLTIESCCRGLQQRALQRLTTESCCEGSQLLQRFTAVAEVYSCCRGLKLNNVASCAYGLCVMPDYRAIFFSGLIYLLSDITTPPAPLSTYEKRSIDITVQVCTKPLPSQTCMVLVHGCIHGCTMYVFPARACTVRSSGVCVPLNANLLNRLLVD
jgi:hypothetical protein